MTFVVLFAGIVATITGFAALLPYLIKQKRVRRDTVSEQMWRASWDDPSMLVSYCIYVPILTNTVTEIPVVDLSQYLLTSKGDVSVFSDRNPLLVCQAAADEFLAKMRKSEYVEGTLINVLSRCYQLAEGQWREVSVAEVVGG